MSRRREPNGAGTTGRILDVAERMLQVRGYNGFSYGDVAAELGITRAALHYHFKGKAELGQALIDRYAARFGAALADLDATAPDAAAKLRGYVGALHRRAQRRPDVPVRDARRRAPHAARPAAAGGLRLLLVQHRLADGRSSRRAAPTGACAAPARRGPAAMVLGALEGGMLIARLDGDVARFTATANHLLAGLMPASARA